MKELVRKHCEYILYQKGSNFLLSVECGRHAVYTLTIKLSPAEKRKYEKDGVPYIDMLARNVATSPTKYKRRKI